MNIYTKVLLPITFSSVLAINGTFAAEDIADETEDKMEHAYEESKDKVRHAGDETKEGAEQAWDKTKEATEDAREKTADVSEDIWKDTKAFSGKAWGSTKDAFSEGVMSGRLETALILNEELNPFDIDFEVDGNKVSLSGVVDSSTDKELAEQIAKGIKGVETVDNNLRIDTNLKQSKSDEQRRDFSQYLSDITTTAWVKTELLANDEINGLDIDVDTYSNKVVLSGVVKTKSEKMLAEEIAKKRKGVQVVNRIKVNS